MRSIEMSAKTVEAAVQAACEALGVDRDDINVSYEVLEFPARKLFKTIPAKVLVKVEEPEVEEVKPVEDAPAPVEALAAPAEEAAPAVEPAAEESAEAPVEEDASADEEVPLDIAADPRLQAAVDYLTPIFKQMGVEEFSFTAVKKGDKYILNGRKCFITNAPLADIITIFAITDKEAGAKGFSMFMVEKGAPGLSIGKHEDKMGIRSSATSDVIMEDCEIPASALIGKEGDGFKIVMQTLDKGRVCAGASALGVARAALEHSIRYSQERIQKGKPIWKHQIIQAKLADMGMRLEAARQLVWRAAMAFDANANDTAKLASMCKCFAGDMVVNVTCEALQIHGGYGYSREYPIEKLYRDAKIFQIFEGTNEIQRTIIAKNMVDEQKIAVR